MVENGKGKGILWNCLQFLEFQSGELYVHSKRKLSKNLVEVAMVVDLNAARGGV